MPLCAESEGLVQWQCLYDSVLKSIWILFRPHPSKMAWEHIHLLPAQRVCSPDVDKAVKDAVSAINNRDHVILYGLPETGSTIKDFETVKDIFDSLGVNDVKAVDVFRLGKVQSDVGVSQSKPRLLKVRLSSSIVHNSLLKKT